jgi:hypothetical protein
MSLFRALIGGVVGAALGAGVWAAISYYTGFELGILAWGIGVVAGLGVRVSAGDAFGSQTGMIAVLTAALGILAGKWFAVSLALSAAGVDSAVPTQGELLDRETTISYIADEVAYERDRQGQRLRWPSGAEPFNGVAEEDYPRDVWADAERRYESLLPSEQDELRRWPWLANPDYLISFIADDLAAERERAGETLDWSNLPEDGVPDREAHYPPDLWEEAELAWETMSEAEREDFKQQTMIEVERELPAALATFERELQWQAFLYTFSIFDLLWFGLAVASAWKLGSGAGDLQ